MVEVSVIVTVLNERSHIDRLLDSLASQTRPPDEIVICDGGSVDGTLAALEAAAARHADSLRSLCWIVEPGANISRGRNLAIAAARGPLIAATDAGVRLAPDWLERLTAPWAKVAPDQVPIAAAGLFLPDPHGVFETALAATVLPLPDDIDSARFLPSSRSVAFTKAAWARSGGYPEWLDYCEDLLFDFALNAQTPEGTTAFAWAPDAVVHFRPRSTPAAFFRQYYRYARGDGKADLWRKRHAVRYATYLVALPLLLAQACCGPFARPLGWAALLAGGVLYCRRPWQRLGLIGGALSRGEQTAAWLWIPVLRAVGDVAKMIGYPVGLWWRWRNRRRPEIHWRRSIGQDKDAE